VDFAKSAIFGQNAPNVIGKHVFSQIQAFGDSREIGVYGILGVLSGSKWVILGKPSKTSKKWPLRTSIFLGISQKHGCARQSDKNSN